MELAKRVHVADPLQHRDQRLRLGGAWQDYDLVFPAEIGAPQHGMDVTHRFQSRLRKTGLPPMRFHDLRHGCATLLLTSGASIREIQTILGHSDLSTTTVYAHVGAELLRANADRMEAALREV